ncbi:MAG: DUF6090 family protein [Bacteroidetes bacterium]|nr:DUF6090 family protein [Bacteroidota bacterium]
MVRLFNSKNNPSKGNIRSYLLYALGEILLVVLGILIALKVNNMNESRILTETANEYLIKIKSNINEDILETERILNFRNELADLCNEVSEKLIANDFEDQLKIQQAIIKMIIEIEINYNRTAFESLKTSGHLSHLKNPILEELLYDYYLRTDQVIMRENDQKDWANILENELDRIGFFYEWSELDKKVITDLFSLFTNYTEDLKAHPGHKIIMRLLFRGGTNKTILTPLYEDHIRLAKEVVYQIDEYLNS